MDIINFMLVLSNNSYIMLFLFFLLLIRQNIWAWVFGGLYAMLGHGSVIFIALKYQHETSVPIYWLVVGLSLCLYGAWVWHKNGHRFFHQQRSYSVSSLIKEPYSKQKSLILVAVLGVLSLSSVFILQGFVSSLHIFIYALALILMADKKVEAWILLIIGAVFILPQLHQLSSIANDSVQMLFSLKLSQGIEILPRLIILFYGFIYWIEKLGKNEEIKHIPLSSLLKIALLSLIYIVATCVAPFLLTYIVCMGGTGCSGVPAGLFLMAFCIVSLIIAVMSFTFNVMFLSLMVK